MNPKIHKIISVIKNLIFIPTCAVCGERLSPIPEKSSLTYGKICFCQSCGEKWERSRAEICPFCSNIAENCTCIPKFFKNRQPNIPSVCFYNPDEDDAASKAILTIKHEKNSEFFDFMAIELYPKIKKTLDKMGISGKDCIFTWTPRKSSSASKYGFDQGREITVRIAKLFSAKAYPLFLRFGGKEQKTLSIKQRKANAKKAIVLNHTLLKFPYKCKENSLAEFVKGKKVVIIDDVLTSGATLEQATKLLESLKADKIVVACLAKTARRAKK